MKKLLKSAISLLLVAAMLIAAFGCASKERTVTFDSNGGTDVESYTVDKDNPYLSESEISTTTKNGRKFAGWYLDDEPFNFQEPINKSITLKAKWFITVTLNLNTGTSISPTLPGVTNRTIDVLEGECIGTDYVVGKQNYTFDGWNTKADGTGTTVNLLTTPIEDTITLYAIFTEHERFTVTFDSNGGTAVSEPIVSVYKNLTVSKPADPTYGAYIFEGWYKGESATAYDFKTPVTESFTLKAKWSSVSVTSITLKAKHDSGLIDPVVDGIEVGYDVTLDVVVNPANASNKKVGFSANNPGLVEFHEGEGEEGAKYYYFTAVGAGTVTITVASEENPAITATVTIVIREGKPAGAISTALDFFNIFTKNATYGTAITAAESAQGSGQYYLTNDIDLATLGEAFRRFPSGPGGAPHETERRFNGVFDGRGYALIGYSVTGTAEEWDLGLFGTIGITGVVKNTEFRNFMISGIGRTGLVAGQVFGTIENCYVNSNAASFGIRTQNSYGDQWCAGGGLASDIRGSFARVENNVIRLRDLRSTTYAANTSCNPLALVVRNHNPATVITNGQYPAYPSFPAGTPTVRNNFIDMDNMAVTGSGTSATGIRVAAGPAGLDGNVTNATLASASNNNVMIRATGSTTGITGFTRLANVDFSALSGAFWNGNVASGATAYPTLKKLDGASETPATTAVTFSLNNSALTGLGTQGAWSAVPSKVVINGNDLTFAIKVQDTSVASQFDTLRPVAQPTTGFRVVVTINGVQKTYEVTNAQAIQHVMLQNYSPQFYNINRYDYYFRIPASDINGPIVFISATAY